MSVAAREAQRTVGARRGGTVRALAVREAALLVRHPVFLVGVFVTIMFHLPDPLGPSDAEAYGIATGQGLLFLSGATMIAAYLNVLRGRRADGDLDASFPLDGGRRIAGHLLSVTAALAVGLTLLVPVWVLMLGPSMEMTVDGQTWSPGLVQLAQAPLLVVAMGLLGVGLGRALPYAFVAPIVAVVLVMSPLTWINPLIVLDPEVADPSRDFVGNAAWQLVFLGGIALGAIVLASRDVMRSSLVVGGGLIAAAAVGAGIVLR